MFGLSLNLKKKEGERFLKHKINNLKEKITLNNITTDRGYQRRWIGLELLRHQIPSQTNFQFKTLQKVESEGTKTFSNMFAISESDHKWAKIRTIASRCFSVL